MTQCTNILTHLNISNSETIIIMVKDKRCSPSVPTAPPASVFHSPRRSPVGARSWACLPCKGSGQSLLPCLSGTTMGTAGRVTWARTIHQSTTRVALSVLDQSNPYHVLISRRVLNACSRFVVLNQHGFVDELVAAVHIATDPEAEWNTQCQTLRAFLKQAEMLQVRHKIVPGTVSPTGCIFWRGKT